MSRKISKSHFGCEVVPVCGTFGAGTPLKNLKKSLLCQKKSQNVMLYIKYKRKPREKNLKKSLFCQKNLKKSLSISGGTYLRYILTIGWGLFAVHLGNRVGSSCGTFGQ